MRPARRTRRVRGSGGGAEGRTIAGRRLGGSGAEEVEEEAQREAGEEDTIASLVPGTI
jgi:hypothetical protein